MSEKKTSIYPPNWTRDEIIIALDFYFKYQEKLPDDKSKEIIELSSLIKRLWYEPEKYEDFFRNPNGVYMKLNNFRRLDPDYIVDGKVGLSRGSKLEEAIWREYKNKRGLLRVHAENIIQHLVESETRLTSDDAELELCAKEGVLLTKVHRVRERKRSLVNKKKNQVIKAKGELNCEACGFNFGKTYGERGDNYIEIHHVKPLSELKPNSKTHLKDLAVVCANCHRMIHRKAPWLTIQELRDSLTK